MNRSRAIPILAAKFAASGLLLWIIFRHVESHEVLNRLRRLDTGLAAWALIPQFASIALMARRWQVLARGLLTFSQALHYTWIGLFYGALLPGGISGDVAKGAALALKDKTSRTVMLPVSIFIDRIVGFYALLVLFCIACVWLGNSPDATGSLTRLSLLGLGGGLAGAAGIPLLFTPPGLRWMHRMTSWIGVKRLSEVAAQFTQAATLYWKHPAELCHGLLLSAGVHASNILFNFLLMRSLGVSLAPEVLVVYYALISVLVMIPVSISGIGIREWLSVMFFPAFGLDGETGVAFAWTCLAVQWLIAACGGGLQLIDLFRSSKLKSQPT